MRFPFAFLAFAALLAPQLLAQQPQPTASNPEVRLEVHEGKTHFYLGDRVQLDLVFVNATGEPCTLNATGYGDLADEVEITPAKGWIEWRTQSGHDYASVYSLGPKEVRIPVVLNQGYVFREPGHYEVRVTTRRLQGKSVTTNSVGFDLEPMPAGVEANTMEEIRAALGRPDTRMRSGTRTRGLAMAHLADLQGDEALRLKVQWILSGDEQMRTYAPEAIATSHNLALQLQLLEAAWRDPQQMPLWDLPSLLEETRVLLRGKNLKGWHMVMSPGEASDPEMMRRNQERAADMHLLMDSLPQRTGENRAAALYYLFLFPGLTEADYDRLRPTIAAEFGTLNSIEQGMLLGGNAWKLIDSPAMQAPLKTLLDKDPQNQWALPRLIEADPQAARPYVARAICGKGWPVPVQKISGLPYDTLPEIDVCLGELLAIPPAENQRGAWRMRADLAARYATAAILPQVRAGWKLPEQDQAVLPLLVRWAPGEALARITAEPYDANRVLNLFFSIDQSFVARHASFPEPICGWLRELLRQGTNKQAGTAAYQLSLAGTSADRPLMEARLAELRKTWTGKLDASFSSANPQTAMDVRSLERELIHALLTSHFWTLSEADATHLADGCLDQTCRTTIANAIQKRAASTY